MKCFSHCPDGGSAAQSPVGRLDGARQANLGHLGVIRGWEEGGRWQT